MDLPSILSNDNVISNCNYFISKTLMGNTSLNIAYNEGSIFSLSNDWLYLIWYFYYNKKHPIYRQIFLLWVGLKGKKPNTYISGSSVLVSSSFSAGTFHGYIGIFEIILEIKNSKKTYTNYIVHENAQKGVKDIIKLAFPEGNIIYIKPQVIYNIESLTLSRIIHHGCHYVCDNEIAYIKNNISPLLVNDLFLKTGIFEKIDRVAVIKNDHGENITDVGVYDYNIIIELCKRQNIKYIDPKDMNEAEFFNIIYHSKNLLFSWGTTHFKGILYISDDCENIIILVKGGFIDQYDGLLRDNQIVFKYKNANIRYIIKILEDKQLLTIDLF